MKLVFILLAALSAWAFAFDAQISTVKTYSMPTNASKVFRGSGLLFKQGGKVFCLTSDHVIFHSANGYRHRIMTSTGQIVDAVYGASDYGSGLAVLAVPALTPVADYPEWAELTPSGAAVKGYGVRVLGFPYESQSVFSHAGGHVENPAEPQELFPELNTVIRVEGSHGEFGMSGGPVFGEDGRFVGVLSHQRLVQGEVPQNTLLVISGADVKTWLTRYFANPASFPIRMTVPPHVQFQGIDHTIWIKDFDVSIGQYWGTGAKQIYLAAQATAQVTGSIPASQDYLNRMRDYLKANTQAHALYIFGFRQKGKMGSFAYGINSMTDFLRRIQDSSLEPIVVASVNFMENLLKPLYALAPQIANQGKFTNGQLGPLSDITYAADRVATAFTDPMGPFSSSYTGFAVIKPGDIDDILTGAAYAAGWKAADQNASGKATELRRLFKEAKTALSKLTL